MNDIDLTSLTIGDLVTHGRLLWEDDDQKTVWLIREGETIRVETTYKNVGAVLEANMRAANDFSRSSALGDLVKVASVPIGIHYEWEKEGITHDDAAINRRLNDPDFAKFRVNSLRL